MKKCASELELDAFIQEHLAAAAAATVAEQKRPGHGPDASGFEEPGRGGVFSPGSTPGLGFGESNALELEKSNGDHLWWSDSVRTPHPRVSTMTGSRTASISVAASPRSTTSGNRALDSESDSDSGSVLDTEGGPCKRGTKSMETKQIRRMVSNRESARRSRRKKHAQLTDLETQVEQLKSESATLFKQLTEANQQFTTAVTDNRILKSDVETLRVKVKMAEDMVARSAMSCGLGHPGLAPFLNSTKMCQALDVLTVTGLDLPGHGGHFKGLIPGPQVQNSPVESTATIESLDSRMSSEVTSCAAGMWP